MPDPNGPTSFEGYGEIEAMVDECHTYCEDWLRYQSLWDVEMANLVPRLKTLQDWMKILHDIKYELCCTFFIDHMMNAICRF